MSIRRFLRGSLLALTIAAGSVPLLFCHDAEATVVLSLTREQLVTRSDLVVRAAVLSQHVQWNEDHTQILTLTRLRVNQFVKGTGSVDLVLRQFGGTLDGITEQVRGDAHVAVGQDVVLFLKKGNGVVYLTALAQALYLVVHSPGREPAVARDLHELSFVQWTAVPSSGTGTISPPAGGTTSQPTAVSTPTTMVFQPPAAEAPETVTHLLNDLAAIVRRLP